MFANRFFDEKQKMRLSVSHISLSFAARMQARHPQFSMCMRNGDKQNTNCSFANYTICSHPIRCVSGAYSCGSHQAESRCPTPAVLLRGVSGTSYT